MQNNSPKSLKRRTEGGVCSLNVEGLHTHFTGKTLPLLGLVAMEQRNFTGKRFLCFVEEDFKHIELKPEEAHWTQGPLYLLPCCSILGGFLISALNYCTMDRGVGF